MRGDYLPFRFRGSPSDMIVLDQGDEEMVLEQRVLVCN